MSETPNKPEPLSNEEIDKIFGMSSPDFTGGEEQEMDYSGDMVECCHYHFLQWMMEAVKDGRTLSKRDKEHAAHHLKGIAAKIYQMEDEEDTVDPLVESLKEVAPNLATLLAGALDPKNMVAIEGTTDSGFTFQAVPDGIRLLHGGKSMRLRPKDAVILAGTIGGWIWPNENMRQAFIKFLKRGKKEIEQQDD